MKTLVRRSAVLALIGFVLSPLEVVHALPTPADSVHFCQLIDFEQWERDHPRPAGKRLALNVGEPRTVRMIYFLPNDRPFRQEVVDSMKVAIRRVQTFYAEQMQAHGYGYKTFRIETDAQGEPLVHRVDGRYPERLGGGPMIVQLGEMFDVNANIYNIILDSATFALGGGSRYSKNGGYAWLDDDYIWGSAHGGYTGVTAHEIGHAFGLLHDFRDDAYIMSYGSRPDRLSAYSAEFLSVHPYFNPEIPIEEGPPPTIELISPRTYPAGSESVPIQLKVADSQGIHQVNLFVFAGPDGTNVKASRGLSGESDAVVEFEYDGDIPSFPGLSLSFPVAHWIRVQVVDSEGNIARVKFLLAEVSPHQIATLEGHTDGVAAVSFSPDGSLLASGLWDRTVLLWDVATREQVATLGHRFWVNAVSFSPDGTLLASGLWDRTVLLWDVATREQVATLEGHTNVVYSVSFSPDGALLATGGWDGMVILWDVLTREKIIAFGHTDAIRSVSFSPDGTTLAAGGEDGTILLWNVDKTPHSLTKVSGEGQGGLVGEQLAKPFVVSVLDQDGSAFVGAVVSFSVTAGGGTLSAATVTTDANGRAATRLTLGSQPGTNTVEATVEGLEPETFTATAAEQAMPHSLTKVCGDDQEGTAGALLAEPLVVSVSDEDGAAMAGVVVSFAVTAGGGTLSSATATTDANGRARTRLTLGSEVGTNTVSATVEGLGPVTFTAIGEESPLASLFDLFGGGKLVALPDSPQLLQNAPNPFNSQTVLSYFLHAPGPARVEVFALTGQRVAVLHQGPQQAGYHRLRWNGRDDAGRPVASGAYLYRLVTVEGVLTRKLTLLR